MAQTKKQARTAAYARMAYPSERSVARTEYNSAPVTGPWISREQIPDLLQSFDRNRDPMIRDQLDDLKKTEKQRREDASGRVPLQQKIRPLKGVGSGMVKKDQPKPAPRPPRVARRYVDEPIFRKRWLQEQHHAAMAQARPEQQDNTPQRGHSPTWPYRSR